MVGLRIGEPTVRRRVLDEGSTAEALTASFHANPKARAVLLGTARTRQPGSVWVVHPLARQSLYFTEQSVIAVLVLPRVPAFGL